MSPVTAAFSRDDAEHGNRIALKGGCGKFRKSYLPDNNIERGKHAQVTSACVSQARVSL